MIKTPSCEDLLYLIRRSLKLKQWYMDKLKGVHEEFLLKFWELWIISRSILAQMLRTHLAQIDKFNMNHTLFCFFFSSMFIYMCFTCFEHQNIAVSFYVRWDFTSKAGVRIATFAMKELHRFYLFTLVLVFFIYFLRNSITCISLYV